MKLATICVVLFLACDNFLNVLIYFYVIFYWMIRSFSAIIYDVMVYSVV